jgi:hypothetical protein
VRHPQDDTAGQQSEVLRTEQFEVAIVREMKNRPIAKDDFRTAVARTNGVAVDQHRRRIGTLAHTVLNDIDVAVDVGKTCWRWRRLRF